MLINTNPTRDTLKAFGVGSLVGFGLLAALGWWKWESPTAAGVCGGLAALFVLAGLFAPPVARWLYVGMAVVFWPVGFVVSHILMAILYYGLLTPIGLIMRAGGRDPLQRSFDRSASTYWDDHPPRRKPERYFKQY